ncbi:hypothetical protein Poli38472_008715 [Pythium oligandrum]|uniref:peptidylprolyl isomerase n=1 Tax=Pythium oligandrum TaxID=41045 RepID=A0A8K1C4P2_PYTOL|nr:hypothetical protein Poli38472_008715 [Pythium oligandrum]|eukprot:TMW56067.1 hypothetical protein Poli38472_008715 [Pythium oligandrum]
MKLAMWTALAAALMLAALPVEGKLGKTDKIKVKVTARPASCPVRSKVGNSVSINYTGMLASNGVKFDANVDRNAPFTFKIGAGRVIKGLEQGTTGMCVGEKGRLTVPPSLAYGATGMAGFIPPQFTLVYDVELLAIK